MCSGLYGNFSRCFPFGSISGSCTRSLIKFGYQGCVGQFGATSIPSAWSSSIFCTTLPNKLKGGNAKNVSERQSRVKASTASAPGSGCQAT